MTITDVNYWITPQQTILMRMHQASWCTNITGRSSLSNNRIIKAKYDFKTKLPFNIMHKRI